MIPPRINVREELEMLSWPRANWQPDKLLAASPFRYDSHPSFYVYLSDTATARAVHWGDSGAIDTEWQRGGIVKLLAFLRDETIRETLDYLNAKCGCGPPAYEVPSIKPLMISLTERYWQMDSRILDTYRYRHPYLGSRGISEKVQRLMGIGYDRVRHAIVIP